MSSQNTSETILNDKSFSKLKLLELIKTLIDDHPIEHYNNYTYNFSSGYRKSLQDIYDLLKIL